GLLSAAVIAPGTLAPAGNEGDAATDQPRRLDHADAAGQAEVEAAVDSGVVLAVASEDRHRAKDAGDHEPDCRQDKGIENQCFHACRPPFRLCRVRHGHSGRAVMVLKSGITLNLGLQAVAATGSAMPKRK